MKDERTYDRFLYAAVVLGLAFLFVQILTFGYGRDQGIYAVVARAVVSGQMPYRDAWDFKPPGIFLIYALARTLLGSSQIGIRIVEVLGLAGMVAAMVRLARVWWGAPRIGWIAGLVAVMAHAQLDFWHTAQPESFGGMVTIYALAVLGTTLANPPVSGPWSKGSPERAAMIRWMIAGALFGFAGLLKPPLAGAGVVVAAALVLRARSQKAPWRAALRPAAAIAIGGASPFVLCLLWFLAKGSLGDLYATLFVFTPHYTALSWVGETIPGMVYWGFTEWLVTYSSLPTVGMLFLLVLRPREPERQGVVVIAGIIAVHIVGVAMQGKFFPYHYGATWPLTALLAGVGIDRVWGACARRGVFGLAVFFAGFAFVALFRSATKDVPQSFRERCEIRMALLVGSRDQEAFDKLASVADVNAVANRAVAAWLDQNTSPDRPVFVWGFEPVIYDLAKRSLASRYIYDVPQRVAWAKEDARATLMRDLAAKPAQAIVVERRDVFPMVTGDAIDSADTLQHFDALRDLLADRYRLADTIEDFDLYLAN